MISRHYWYNKYQKKTYNSCKKYHDFIQQNKWSMIYNKYILENASEYMVTITAIDVPSSDVSSNKQQQLLETVLNCKHVETTGTLPHVLQVTANKQYDIFAIISIDVGLLNGAHCCIKHVQHENNNSPILSIIWVQLEDPDIGKQQRQKYKFLHMHHKKDQLCTPIFAIKCKFAQKTNG